MHQNTLPCCSHLLRRPPHLYITCDTRSECGLQEGFGTSGTVQCAHTVCALCVKVSPKGTPGTTTPELTIGTPPCNSNALVRAIQGAISTSLGTLELGSFISRWSTSYSAFVLTCLQRCSALYVGPYHWNVNLVGLPQQLISMPLYWL